MAQNVITGLDIGSNSIKAVVLEGGKTASFRLPRRLKKPSAGMRKGAVTDVADAAVAVARVFGELKEISRDAASECFFWASATLTSRRMFRAALSRFPAPTTRFPKTTWKEAGKTAQTMLKFSSNRTIIHNIPREYIADGVGGVGDPSGMIGGRLEADCLIIGRLFAGGEKFNEVR